jgi:DNA-binding transcriptional LysR family regulator
MEMDVAENIKKYVERGVGVSVLSSLAFTDEDKERFSLFNINHLLGRTEYGIYFRKDRYMTTAMKEFIRIFAPEICENLPSHKFCN